MPAPHDLAAAPPDALAAFAAGCTRRLLPLLASLWPDAPPEGVRAVTGAAELAEAVGADKPSPHREHYEAAAAAVLRLAADPRVPEPARHLAGCAFNALSLMQGGPAMPREVAGKGAREALCAVVLAARAAGLDITDAVRADFDALAGR